MGGPPSCWFTRFRFTGGDQTSLVVARVETQRSSLPAEWPTTSSPGRPEERNISSPSRRIAVRGSRYGRSEERRVGEEGRSRGAPDHLKKKNKSIAVRS